MTGDRAYERMVDRVLADPAYGERWARVWLDRPATPIQRIRIGSAA
jgi:hypothetical protein